MFTLISFSILDVPLPPRTEKYALGVVEGSDGQRKIVQIEQKYFGLIEVGVKGNLEQVNKFGDNISTFIPINNNSKKVLEKVALVTGSTSGIGRAIAIELTKKGYSVIINSDKSRKEGLKVVDMIKEMGGDAIYIKADVSQFNQVENMFNKALKYFEKIDILINNAGIVMDKKIENLSEEQWDTVISVNLKGAFICSKSAIPIMKKQNYGRIINISSVVGQMGNIGQANYSAAKGGLISFTKTIARELAGDNITANVVAPGFINTNMVAGIPNGILKKIISQIPLNRLGEPEEVAKLVSYLSSDDSAYITGQVININGGVYM